MCGVTDELILIFPGQYHHVHGRLKCDFAHICMPFFRCYLRTFRRTFCHRYLLLKTVLLIGFPRGFFAPVCFIFYV